MAKIERLIQNISKTMVGDAHIFVGGDITEAIEDQNTLYLDKTQNRPSVKPKSDSFFYDD